MFVLEVVDVGLCNRKVWGVNTLQLLHISVYANFTTVNRYVLTKDFSTSCDKNEEREKQEILGFYSPLKLYPNLFYNTVNWNWIHPVDSR